MMAPARDLPDQGTLGLAVCLAALAAHALMTLTPGAPQPLEIAARVIAYFLLPGWAATRLLFGRRALGPFEMAGSMVVCGTGLAVVSHFAARVSHLHPESVALILVVLSLAVLGPRRGAPAHADVTAPARERSGAAAPAPAGTAAPNARTRS